MSSMSLVYITHHNESVYQYQENKNPDQNLAKPERKDTLKNVRIGKKLKDHSKIKDSQFGKQNLKEEVTKHSENKKSVPKPSSTNKEVKLTKKTTTRIKEKPKPVKSGCAIKYVYTRNGDTKSVIHSGLVPFFRLRESFGNVPEYLHKIKHYNNPHPTNITKNQSKAFAAPMASQTSKMKTIRLAAGERLSILDGLKLRWKMLQEKLQLLPVITDTIPKKNRKGELIRLIMQLEQDIFFLESNPIIYVLDE